MTGTLNVYLISLGCAKNLVDSEIMLGVIKDNGWQIVEEPLIADVIIINTCGFIQSAKEETIRYILDLARYKKEGNCRLLIAVGCMVEKYRSEMLESMPEIDLVLGTGEYQKIAHLIGDKLSIIVKDINHLCDPYLLRDIESEFSAYLKIAEGCDNCCSYCLIPQLRGPLKSRKIEDILFEAKSLIDKGVKEIIIIAQDITSYGRDIYGENRLATLLTQLAELPIQWIRLLYAYPSHIDEELLKVMAKNLNICHYLDLPLQHINNRILHKMNRQDTREIINEKIDLIYKYLPDAALRTTMMVGFPGETEEEWLEMLKFLEEGKFDWVGVFSYSREDDTLSSTFDDQIDEEVKDERLNRTMAALSRISEKKQERYLGQILDVLVEDITGDESGYYLGRTKYQAPEVDGMVYITSKNDLQIGDIVRVRITRTDIYDLMGETI